MTQLPEDQPCDLCEQPEDCSTCDGSGDDMYGGSDDGCENCGGTGEVIREHCCDCGGSPYCQCCATCGNYAGTCGCPIKVTTADGTTRTL